MRRPSGPIGHCSAALRRMIEIDEEEALGRTIRVRRPAVEGTEAKKEKGGRFARPASLGVPAAFHNRFVAADGRRTSHFAMETVTKTRDGGCRLKTAKGSRDLGTGAGSQHSVYIERPDAVATISPASFDQYQGRDSAVELIGGERAIFSNISTDAAERAEYWRVVHDCENTPGADRVTLQPANASRSAWSRMASDGEVPPAIREIAAEFTKEGGKRKSRSVDLEDLGIDIRQARALVKQLSEALGSKRGKQALRLSEGRGGRSQFRFHIELPAELDAEGRLAVTREFCSYLDDLGLMLTGTIHAPDHHNDSRNYHLHIVAHDRPASKIGDQWDFAISEPVPGQHNRVRFPHRQNKVANWARDPDGGNHRDHGAAKMKELRQVFADLCNARLERVGVNTRFHPGTLKSLGCDREPQERLGPKAAPLEAAGVPTEVGMRNAERLWTYALRAALEAADQRAEERAKLKRRIEQLNASVQAMPGASTGLEADGLLGRLQTADAALKLHDHELAQYEVTRLIARSRPVKTFETCDTILRAIADGSASAAECRQQAAVAARASEATAFLRDLEAVERDHAKVVSAHRAAVRAAQVEVDAVEVAVTALESRPAELEVPARQPAASDRDIVEAFLDRILAEDIAIMRPTKDMPHFHVPGVTRSELRALTSPALKEMAQKRLASLAEIQVKRMRAAAASIANVGYEAVQRAADRGDDSAARALKHAAAYKADPIYLAAFEAAKRASQQPNETAGAVQEPTPDWRSNLLSPIRRLFERQPAARVSEASSPALASAAHPVSAPPQTTREDAVKALAAALVKEPGLRVVQHGGRLAIDPTLAPDWARSADAFSDEPAVLDAMRQRHRSPWMDVDPADRDELLGRLSAALKGAGSRPLARVEGQWQVSLADRSLINLVQRWRGFDALHRVLTRADLFWARREDAPHGSCTSVRGPVPDFSSVTHARRRQRAESIGGQGRPAPSAVRRGRDGFER